MKKMEMPQQGIEEYSGMRAKKLVYNIELT